MKVIELHDILAVILQSTLYRYDNVMSAQGWKMASKKPRFLGF